MIFLSIDQKDEETWYDKQEQKDKDRHTYKDKDEDIEHCRWKEIIHHFDDFVVDKDKDIGSDRAI